MTITIDSLVLAEVQALINLCRGAENVSFSPVTPVYVKFITDTPFIAVKFSSDDQGATVLGQFLVDSRLAVSQNLAHNAMLTAGMGTNEFYLASA